VCHERVAPPRDVRYIAVAILTVAQGTSQLGDVEAEAGLIDREAGPSFGQQLTLADDFAMSAHQKAKKVECTTTKPGGMRKNAERPGGKYFRDGLVFYR
jgi:hypothetical protein